MKERERMTATEIQNELRERALKIGGDIVRENRKGRF